jgi:hypothetical protein
VRFLVDNALSPVVALDASIEIKPRSRGSTHKPASRKPGPRESGKQGRRRDAARV